MKKINWPLAISSLLTSIIIWSIVFSQNSRPQVGRVYSLKVQPSGLTSDLVPTKFPETVTVSVQATENQLKQLGNVEPYAVVDLTRATEGSRAYPVQVFPTNFREYVTDGILSARVDIERVISKKVPVVIETKGELSDLTLGLDRMVADPASVTVKGPRSEVEGAILVRGLLDLSVVQAGGGRSYLAPLEALGEKRRPLPNVATEPLFARVSVTLGSAPETRQVVVSPDVRGRPGRGFLIDEVQFEPTQVMAKGSSMLIAKLLNINTQPIDIEGITETKQFVRTLKVPEGVRVIGTSEVRVTVKVKAVVPQDLNGSGENP